jgi:hypothetical protein
MNLSIGNTGQSQVTAVGNAVRRWAILACALLLVLSVSRAEAGLILQQGTAHITAPGIDSPAAPVPAPVEQQPEDLSKSTSPASSGCGATSFPTGPSGSAPAVVSLGCQLDTSLRVASLSAEAAVLLPLPPPCVCAARRAVKPSRAFLRIAFFVQRRTRFALRKPQTGLIR